MHTILSTILLLFLLSSTSIAFAGGPLAVEGPTGNTPVKYQDPNITVNIENGTLGTKSNVQADTLVADAFSLWNDVSTSTVNIIIDEVQIPTDVNLSNYDTYLPNASGTIFNADDNLNPIVYDNNGEIIDAFFGLGASDVTIGFAASIYTAGGSSFKEGYAVINGKDVGLSDTRFKLLITHEIGHFIGLDHTQTNINPEESTFGIRSFCSTDSEENYAVMYPFVCRQSESLHPDDIVSVSTLYPEPDINDSFGVLQGLFVDTEGAPVLGANLWLQNISNGNVYSVVSDFLLQGNGFYRIFLPAGNYTLHANSINTEFNGGSSIGPYTRDINDISFQDPNPITEISYKDDAGNEAIITINSNETKTINFNMNGDDVVLNNNTDEDDSISDLFGATSPFSLLILVTAFAVMRRITTASTQAILKSQ